MPDRFRVCGPGTTWSHTECIPSVNAGTTATLRTSFPEHSAWFEVPSHYVERRRFRRTDDQSLVITLESTEESDYRVDNAQGCGWDVRQRTVLPTPCDGAPIVADCWGWTVVLTTNPHFATTSLCEEAALGTELWDVETGRPTGVSLDLRFD